MQALTNQPITVFGEGQQTRSFCYVDDLVEGFCRFMATPPEVVGPINLGNPTEFTMIELATQVIEMTNSKSKIVHLPLPQDDPKQRKPDITEAKAQLGWEPKVPLKDGLEKTIAYFPSTCFLRPARAQGRCGQVAGLAARRAEQDLSRNPHGQGRRLHVLGRDVR